MNSEQVKRRANSSPGVDEAIEMHSVGDGGYRSTGNDYNSFSGMRKRVVALLRLRDIGADGLFRLYISQASAVGEPRTTLYFFTACTGYYGHGFKY